jgi:hypothetical protein
MLTKYSTEELILKNKMLGVVMGGYVRDSILGLPWKDIDVFKWVDMFTFARIKESGTHRVHTSNRNTMERYTFTVTNSDSYYNLPGEFLVAECESLPGLQLIICQSPVPSPMHVPPSSELAKQKAWDFPCSLSKAWFNLNVEPEYREIKTTPPFDKSVANREVWLTPSCPAEYEKRMRSKFADWTILRGNCNSAGDW